MEVPITGAIDSLAVSPAPSATGGTVMVVDDNPANLKLMEGMLRLGGYEVRSFPGGAMALAAASENPPDLILLDIDMPEMTGYEVCERLKANPRLCEIPVIFLSAMNGREDRLRAFRSGGVDYVSKPFQFEEVQARVDAHVKLRRLQRKIENDNFLLQELVAIQVRRIADAHAETLFAIAKLAETRDDETGKHVERVQALCRLLAVGLSEQPRYKTIVSRVWIDNIFYASPLHDIGKVAMPDRIFLKPGPLTPAELGVMRIHTLLGAKTLQSVHDKYPDNDFIEMGIEIARSHHEWWNGTGYPDGLAGEEIPLCARVVAVADCYDALRSRRSYKPAFPHDRTCAMILLESGTHFDPAVLAVFSELADTFRDARDRVNAVPQCR
jgi:putative two-component system response regulator